MERLRTLGLVFLSLGIIEWSWAFFCAAGGGILGIVSFADDKMAPLLWLGTGAYVLIGMVSVILGAIHVYAGVRLRSGKGLIATILALATCMVSMVFALYCAPFSFGALVYGLIVMADAETRKLLDG